MLLLHLPNSAPAQTSIIAIRTPAYISVGADSRRTTTHITIDGQERQGVSKSIESICKIGRVGNVFFAIAGFRDADGHALAIDSIRMAKTINEIASIFVEKVIPPLTEELEKVRRGVPDYYRQRFVDAEAAQVIFFGFENKIATLMYVAFEAVNPISEPVRIATRRVNCPGDCNLKGRTIALLGRHEAIDAIYDRPAIWKNGPIVGIRKLIKREVDAVPDEVAEPIDILHLTRERAWWVQKKPQCLDNE